MVSNRIRGLGSGALSGASTGASIGSIIPGIGTGLGAGLGAGIGALSGLFGSKSRSPQKSSGGSFLDTPGQLSEFNRYTPEQQNLLSSLMGMLTGQGGPQGGLLGDYLDDESMSAPYMRQFKEEIVPGLAEQFSGMGSGSQRSSAFQQALGSAGGKLQENLAAMNSQRRQSLLQSILGQALQPQLNQYFTPGGPSPWAGILGSLGQGLASGLTQVGGNWLQSKLNQGM